MAEPGNGIIKAITGVVHENISYKVQVSLALPVDADFISNDCR